MGPTLPGCPEVPIREYKPSGEQKAKAALVLRWVLATLQWNAVLPASNPLGGFPRQNQYEPSTDQGSHSGFGDHPAEVWPFF